MSEEWWITEDHWLPRGRIAEHQGVPLGPFGSRALALTVRTLVEKAQGRDGRLWVGRVGERDINRAEAVIPPEGQHD